MADVGSGATIAFASTAFTAGVLSINCQDIARAVVETTTLATTNAKTFMPGDLYDPGGIEIEIQYDPDAQPPLSIRATPHATVGQHTSDGTDITIKTTEPHLLQADDVVTLAGWTWTGGGAGVVNGAWHVQGAPPTTTTFKVRPMACPANLSNPTVVGTITPASGVDAENITITFPVPTGLSNGATLVGSGFVAKWSPSIAGVDELMKAKITVKYTSTLTWTDAS